MQSVIQDGTATLIARATRLRADLEALCAESRALVERGHECTFGRLRPICGGSDIALVITTITDVALCLPCISMKTGVPVEEVNQLLGVIVKTFRLAVGPRRCHLCLEHRTTFGVTKGGVPRLANQRGPI